eukprot:jgi/Mesen1/6869/ME000351S05978
MRQPAVLSSLGIPKQGYLSFTLSILCAVALSSSCAAYITRSLVTADGSSAYLRAKLARYVRSRSGYEAEVPASGNSTDGVHLSGSDLGRQSACSCYNVENKVSADAFQGLCVCERLCFNGSHAVRIGDPETQCRVAMNVPDWSPLKSPLCNHYDAFLALQAAVARDAGFPLTHRPLAWLDSRAAVEWRANTTYLQLLNASDARSPAAFFRKVAFLLLVNSGALRESVSRGVVVRTGGWLARVRAHGAGAFQPSVLRNFLILAMQPIYGASFQWTGNEEDRVLGDVPLSGGVVEFEDAFFGASEARPLCFERLILPGSHRDMLYSEGGVTRSQYQEHFHVNFELPKPAAADPAGATRLLLLAPPGGRRPRLSPPGLAKLLALFKAANFSVTRAALDESTPLKEQVRLLDEADVVLALPGMCSSESGGRGGGSGGSSNRDGDGGGSSEGGGNGDEGDGDGDGDSGGDGDEDGDALLVPLLFAREHAIVFELVPYNVLAVETYLYAKSVKVTYMMRQLERGAPLAADKAFAGLPMQACALDEACRTYFGREREVNISDEDEEALRAMIELANMIVRGAKESTDAGGKRVIEEFDRRCVARMRNQTCHEDVVFSHLAGTPLECVLQSKC